MSLVGQNPTFYGVAMTSAPPLSTDIIKGENGHQAVALDNESND
jgi:hypothetical protein